MRERLIAVDEQRLKTLFEDGEEIKALCKHLRKKISHATVQEKLFV